MSSFESSLRSSPKSPSKKSSRDNLGKGSPVPLKQALLNQQTTEASRLVGAISGFNAPIAAGVDSIGRMWEPPLSCQRAPYHTYRFGAGGKANTVYFPLELSTSDYIAKVWRLIAVSIASMSQNKSYAENKRPESHSADIVATFMTLLSPNSRLLMSVWPRCSSSLLADLQLIVGVLEHTNTLVSVYDAEVSVHNLQPENDETVGAAAAAGRLIDLSSTFLAARSIVEGVLKLSVSDTQLASTAEVCNSVLNDMEQLEQQYRLHRVSKDQRMAALGWLWPSIECPSALRASFGRSQSLDFTQSIGAGGVSPSFSVVGGGGTGGGSTTGESKLEKEEQQRWENVRAEAEEVTFQLQALLQPTTLANVQLFHRLVSIVQDLDVLMRALSADSEYQEAQRLRELKAIVDNTVTTQGRALLDQVKQCCTQAQMLVGELRQYCDECRSRGGYYQSALQSEQIARELNSLQKELRTNGISPFSLLSQPSVVERLSREGSAFVNSDFLFSEPHQQHQQRVLSSTSAGVGGIPSGGASGELSPGSPVRQQLQAVPASLNSSRTLRASGGAEGLGSGTTPISIGSLVIRAGSNAVLNAVKATWPGLTALSKGALQQGGSATIDTTLRSTLQSSAALRSPSFGEPAGLQMQMPRSPSNGSLGGFGTSTARSVSAGAGTGFMSPGFSPSNSGPVGIREPDPFARTTSSFGQQSYPPADDLPDFIPSESYNEVGFSPTILSVLMSFEELQNQLHELLSPAAIALTQLIQRLVGISSDLLHLADRCHRSGQYGEGDRILALRSVIEATIDADLADGMHELVCGRGRRRIDNVQVLMQQVQVGSKELQRLAIRSRTESDFTGAQALDEVAADLTRCLTRIDQMLREGEFSMLDSDNGASHPDAGLEINEHIAREGTGFITADYIFQFASGREGHSIGSFAIIAGAGAVLRFIRAEWPDLSALSAPLFGQPQLPSHGHEGHWGDGSFDHETKTGGPVSSPLQESASGAFNFRDAPSLRQLGFDAASLRLAGFSDIAVVTAGYTAAELRDANFSTEQLRQAGLSDSALRVVGYQTEQQADVLASLFRATGGGKWKDGQGWKELLKAKRFVDNTPAHLLPVSLSGSSGIQQQQQQLSQRYLLSGLHGIRCDENSGDVLRIHLASNNLRGQLPSGLGSLTSLTQLILSNNQLEGVLPACLGLLVSLENLHLDGNDFEGEIPKSLKSLEHLVVLKLEKNRLSGSIPAVLGGLHRLRRLDVSHNQLTGTIPARITQLPVLQELLLNDNQLTGFIPDAIGQLTNLTSLHLQNNLLHGYIPASIARLSKLTGFNIQHNPDLAVDRLQLQRALPRCRVKM